jgi:hypothetical protein
VDKALNTLGVIFQSFFVGIAVLATQPFQCYSHPEVLGSSSIAMYPEVICWRSDHGRILGVAVGAFCTFVMPFVGACAWAMIYTRHGIVKNDIRFLVRFRFLILRYRPERTWWGGVFLMRLTMYAFAPIIPADFPHLQLMYLATVSIAYLLLECYFWPWKHHAFSVFDCVVGYLLVLLMLAAFAFIEKPENQLPYSVLVFLFMIVIAVTSVVLSASIMYWSMKHGIFGTFGPDKTNEGDVETLCTHLIDFIAKVDGIDGKALRDLVRTMSRMEQAVLMQIAKRADPSQKDRGTRWNVKERVFEVDV